LQNTNTFRKDQNQKQKLRLTNLGKVIPGGWLQLPASDESKGKKN